MLELDGIPINPPLWLAPMAGVTDRDFRTIVRRIGGVGVVSMEFVPAKGLVRGERRAHRLLPFSQEERPLAIQIYGSDPQTMAAAAQTVEALGADICDINMGCPANHVLKGCAGAALMGDLRIAENIIRTVRQAVRLPLTVKFRLGLDEKRHNYLELGRICAAHGVAAVSLHARTARQMFRGTASWPEIARLKAELDIPVIGNGDITTPDDALRMLHETGCDGLMIGRGALLNPWLFRQIAARLAESEVQAPTLADRRDLILAHFRTVLAREEPGPALHKLRTFTAWYSRGLPQGVRLRQQLEQLRQPNDVLTAVEQFFAAAILAEAA